MDKEKIILHCMRKSLWEERKNKEFWGKKDMDIFGFIHCSTIDNIHLVTPNWKDLKDELVILCIDRDKLKSEVKYEDLDNLGMKYPHIYGLVNNDAVIKVLPYNKDGEGNWIRNQELR